LAEELVMNAGLEMPVVEILNQANKNAITTIQSGKFLKIATI
jgi:hypothetical protein